MTDTVRNARTAKGKIIKPYPKIGYLMISKKLVVMVTGYGNSNSDYPCFSGVVISDDIEANEDKMPVGFYSRTWSLDSFERLNLTISLGVVKIK